MRKARLQHVQGGDLLEKEEDHRYATSRMCAYDIIVQADTNVGPDRSIRTAVPTG